jgi:hypothetical protein
LNSQEKLDKFLQKINKWNSALLIYVIERFKKKHTHNSRVHHVVIEVNVKYEETPSTDG